MENRWRDLPALLFCLAVLWHVGASMRLEGIQWVGGLLAIGMWSLPVRPAAPTVGLGFITLVMGGLAGYFMMEEVAMPGTWPAYFRVFAGFCLSGVLLLLWLLWARPPVSAQHPVDRGTQNLALVGLCLLLLTPLPRDPSMELQVGARLGYVQLFGVGMAVLALTLARVPRGLWQRFAWFLPALVLAPAVLWGLYEVQRPLIRMMFSLAPDLKSGSIGFSPFQRLDASAFLNPSNRAVMRVQGDAMPGFYLVGNRHDRLDRNHIWETVRPAQEAVPVGLDAQDARHFRLEHAVADAPPYGADGLTITSLRWDRFLFLPPTAGEVWVAAPGLTQNSHRVWEGAFERDARKEWRVYPTEPRRDSRAETWLALPPGWDADLAREARRFADTDPRQVVSKIRAAFLTRPYSLEVRLDPREPLKDFLLNERPGYCFWYATAAAMLLRANDVPSRLASGYLVTESLGRDAWLVRERDAHSWVEWQDEQGDWHSFDPTPPSLDLFQAGYQGSRWNRAYHLTVIRVRQFLDALEFSDTVENVLILCGFAILVLLFVREYRRIRTAAVAAGSNSARRWQRLWRRFLAAARLPDHRHWTSETYLAHLPGEWSEPKRNAATEFLRAYGARRFADGGGEGDLLEEKLRAFRRQR